MLYRNDEYNSKIKREKNYKVFDTQRPLTKFFLLMGTIIMCLLAILIMKHFFVDKSNITNNYSTDKRLVYVTIEGSEELVATQKYVSDSGYDMRYDVERFKVYRFRNQDVFKSLENDGLIMLIEKAILPADCNSDPLKTGYNSCYKYIDALKEEYFISVYDRVYKITVNIQSENDYNNELKERIKYMISTFEILNDEN